MTARRGRPRSEAAKKIVLSSALDILEKKGLARLTVEAVAAKSGVGKPTIYRYWANAQELSMAAIMEQGAEAETSDMASTGLEELRQQLRAVIARFSTKSGKQATMLLATADPESEISKGFRNQVILKSRAQGREILAGVFAGDAGHPIESLLDMIYGPIFYRLLTKHAPLEAGLADDIVDVIAALMPSDGASTQ